MPLAEALAELRKGRPIILFDSEKREGEADMVYPAAHVGPKEIYRLRAEAGGMIVLAIGSEVAEDLRLPFLHDLFREAGIPNTYFKTNYNDPPPYTTPVNHVDAHTGVTDNDKAMAVRGFSAIVGKPGARAVFLSRFRTPGHLPICVSRGIGNRRGHTELAVELSRRAGLPPAMVLCEMLGKGKALPKAQAKAYAKKNRLAFIEGRDIA